MVLTRYICIALMWTLLIGISNAEALSSIKATTTGDGNYTISVADIQDLMAIDVTLSYDTAALSNPQMQSGAFASAAYMEANTLTPGTVRAVYMYTTDGAFNGAGLLGTLKFTIADSTKGCLKELKAEGYSKTGQLVAIQPVIDCQQKQAATTDSTTTQTSTQTTPQTTPPAATSFKVTPSAGAGGSMNPPDAITVYSGSSMSFTLMPATGYQISGASGCGGTLNGNIFSTGAISGDCTVVASFSLIPPPTTPSEPSTSSSDTTQATTTTSSGSMSSLNAQLAAQQAAQLAAQQAANASGSSARAIPSGVITGSGKTTPDISDAMRAIRIAIGVIQPTAADFANGDVAPLVNGKPAPDGKIGIDDAIIILRKSVGLVSW